MAATLPASEVYTYLLSIRDGQNKRIRELQVTIGLIESGFQQGDAPALRAELHDCEVVAGTATTIWGYLGRMYGE